jgi:hypothetical protein
MIRWFPPLLVAMALLHVQPVLAQGTEQEVLELNQQAMEAYLNLEIEQAKLLLVEALTLAERAGLEGRALARTYVNLGVVTVGGENDRQSAFEFFKAALDEDPGVWPDPATSTPEVDEAFHLARGRYEMETGTSLPGRADLSPEDMMQGLADDGERLPDPEGPDGERDAVEEYDFGELPRTFVHVGFSIGAATARSGRPADPQPPDDCFADDGQLRPECQSYRVPAQEDCDGPDACVRVNEPGLLPAMGLKLTVGHYILPRLALATTVRIGFQGGDGFLSQWMIGVRAQYLFTDLAAEGFNAAAFVGGSVGQIQVRPDQGRVGDTPVRRPFVSSGPGSFQLGAVLGYRFTRNFGIQATPEVHMFLPTNMFVFEMTAGIETAF